MFSKAWLFIPMLILISILAGCRQEPPQTAIHPSKGTGVEQRAGRVAPDVVPEEKEREAVAPLALREAAVEGGADRLVAHLGRRLFNRGQVAPFGERVLLFEQVGSGERFNETVWVFDAEKGLFQLKAPPRANYGGSNYWLPDGDYIVLTESSNARLLWISPEAELQTFKPESPVYTYRGLAVSPKGDAVAMVRLNDPGDADFGIESTTLEKGVITRFDHLIRRPARMRAGEFVELDWSPDARFIVFENPQDPEKDATDVWILERATGKARLLIPNAGHPRWSPDGRFILVSSPEGYRFFTPEGAVAGAVPESAGLSDPVWRHDGRAVLFTRRLEEGPSGVVYDITTRSFTDIGSGRPLGWLPGGDRVWLLVQDR